MAADHPNHPVATPHRGVGHRGPVAAVRSRRSALVAVVLVLTLSGLGACSSASSGAKTVSEGHGTAATAPAGGSGGASPPAAGSGDATACGAVTAANVEAAGISAVTETPKDVSRAFHLDPSLTSTACQAILATSDGRQFSLTLIVMTGAKMSDYTVTARALPLGQPVAGVGDAARFQLVPRTADDVGSSWMLALSGSTMISIEARPRR